MNTILNFWFPDNNYQKWWFKSNENLDKYIYDNYYQLMLDSYNNMNNINNTEEIISNIILLDQFSRNINRIVPIDINSYTIKALVLSQQWIENNYHLSQPIKYTVFALMPFRHMHTIKYNMYVLELLDTMKCFSDDIIYIKFKNTTSKKSLD